MEETRAGLAKYCFRPLPSAPADVQHMCGRKMEEVVTTKVNVSRGAAFPKKKAEMHRRKKFRPLTAARSGKRSPPVGPHGGGDLSATFIFRAAEFADFGRRLGLLKHTARQIPGIQQALIRIQCVI